MTLALTLTLTLTLALTLALTLTRALPPGVHGLGRFLSVVLARGLPFVLTCLAGLALTLDLPYP